jgi:hypothetical protein
MSYKKPIYLRNNTGNTTGGLPGALLLKKSNGAFKTEASILSWRFLAASAHPLINVDI